MSPRWKNFTCKRRLRNFKLKLTHFIRLTSVHSVGVCGKEVCTFTGFSHLSLCVRVCLCVCVFVHASICLCANPGKRSGHFRSFLKIDLHFLCLTRHIHIHTQVTKQFPYLVLRGKHVAGAFYVCKWKADGLMAQRVGWETAGDSSWGSWMRWALVLRGFTVDVCNL